MFSNSNFLVLSYFVSCLALVIFPGAVKLGLLFTGVQ